MTLVRQPDGTHQIRDALDFEVGFIRKLSLSVARDHREMVDLSVPPHMAYRRRYPIKKVSEGVRQNRSEASLHSEKP